MCCVVNCSNTNRTDHKMFNFSNRQDEKEVKENWIKSIKRIY